MEPYTPGAEIFENGVLYTARYHVPTAEEEDATLDRFRKEHPELHDVWDAPPPDITEFYRRMEERYTYKRRPEAEKGAKQFIALAINLSKRYEISMEITRRERSINVKMDVYTTPFFGNVKDWLDALFRMSSEYDFLPHKSGEYVTLSIDYALYDRYDNKTGEKVDWQ